MNVTKGELRLMVHQLCSTSSLPSEVVDNYKRSLNYAITVLEKTGNELRALEIVLSGDNR